MAKFKVGDYVAYSNKHWGFDDVRGTIISRCNAWDQYVIKLDTPKKHYQVGSKECRSNGILIDHEFHPIHQGQYRRSKSSDCFVVGLRANLKSGEKPYDPTQQGDQDDDI